MGASKDKKKPTRRQKGTKTIAETTVDGDSKPTRKSQAKKGGRKPGATLEATLATVADDSNLEAPSKGTISKPMKEPDEPESDLPVKKTENKLVVKKQRKAGSKAAGPELVIPSADEVAALLASYRMAETSLQSCVESFLNRALLREMPVEALIAEFRCHKRDNDHIRMTAFTANAPKNRYKDVGCLDNNRVVLHLGDQSYIHANYVGAANEPRKFICCQAPIDTTVVDFWHMVAQEGTRCIVMLCNYIEKNVPKCAHYLPAVPNVPQSFGLVTVTALRSERLALPSPSKTIINRTILSLAWESASPVKSVSPNNSTHTARAMKHHLQVEHLHWVDWPDRGVPPADNVPIELVQHVQQYAGNPIVVHCSAGIGRTGCFVMIDILLGQFWRRVPWNPNLFILLQEIRQSRNNSIQTEHQYLYVHQVLINFLKKECLLTPEMVKAHFVTWTPQYNKRCNAFN